MFLGLNWSILLVFFALGTIGVWVSYSFLNKNGLYLFSIVAVLIGITMGCALMFSLPISVLTVIMPVVYLALLTCLNKFGKDEAKRLFFMVLVSMLALFVCNFFLAAYEDSAMKSSVYLSWDFLGVFVSQIIAFVAACAITFFLLDKIRIKKIKSFLKLAIFIAIASAIDAVICTVLAFTGSASFGQMLLIILIKIVIVTLVSLGLGYFEKFLNREPKKVEETNDTNENAKEDALKENKSNEEIKTPEDID